MTSFKRWLAGIAIAVALFTTIIGPLWQEYQRSRQLDTGSPIILLGGHLRWQDDGMLEFEAYFLNIQPSVVPGGDFSLHVIDRISHGTTTPIPSPFLPFASRQFREAVRVEVPPYIGSGTFFGDDGSQWRYWGDCVDAAFQVTTGCDRNNRTAGMEKDRIHPSNEARWRAYAVECCGFVLPPFDLFDARCEVVALDLACSVGAYNYHRENATGPVELQVTANARNGTVLFSRTLHDGLTLEANATTILSVSFPDAVQTMLATGEMDFVVTATSQHPRARTGMSHDSSAIPWPPVR